MTLAALILSLATLLLTGLMAGTFFTWSNAVMPGLDAIRPAEAIAAMRSMNAKILNPAFLATFMFTMVSGLAAGILLLLDGSDEAASAMFAAAGVYAVGGQIVTAVVNVPMNNALMEAETPNDEDAAKLWTDFSSKWTRWNLIRCLACAVSLGLAGLSLYLI